MRSLFILAFALITATPAPACEVALLLAMDVSGSVDLGEYRLQTEGLANALNDPNIAEALLRGQVALAVVQWSGTGRQELSMPWRRMLSEAEIRTFSARVRAMPRAYYQSGTAIGDALEFSRQQFPAVSDCKRHVIDVSGDGPENAGKPTSAARQAAIAVGISINGLAIEAFGISITEYYRKQVITKDGFVITARGHLDYPRAIREKILREIITPIS